MTNKKFLLTLVKMVAFMGIMGIFLGMPLTGHAESVFSQALDTLYTTFTEARKVVYITAGFGLIGVAVAAIAGKLPWQWLSMIAVALFTLAVAEKIVMYITDTDTISGINSDFNTQVNEADFKLNFSGDNVNRITDSVNRGSSEDLDFKTFMQTGLH